jgi:predicted PurR-regulated permease PerM
MHIVRIILAVVLGFALYWIVEFILSNIHNRTMDMIVVIFSPISIFGWIACLVMMVMAYMLLGFVDWGGINSTSKSR